MFAVMRSPYGAYAVEESVTIEHSASRTSYRHSVIRSITRGNRDSPARNPERNPARILRNPFAVNPARNNRGSPMNDITRMLDLHADQGRHLYFAYGSNIHVSQMAERCPRSLFVGAAALPSHRWQINERGVANVVPSPNRHVEGLVYLVDGEDEKALDRSEGVSKKLYERQLREVDLKPHPTLCEQKASLVAAELARQRQHGQGNNAVARRGNANQPQIRHELRLGGIKVLVYVSERYKADGAIRPEYISRMKKAMADGLKLGISASYVEECINPLVDPKHRDTAQLVDESRRLRWR
ncbi:hypothetical protein MY10362_005731 [Beauveria mimosiformis]